jgi:ankyrin repeat protein
MKAKFIYEYLDLTPRSGEEIQKDLSSMSVDEKNRMLMNNLRYENTVSDLLDNGADPNCIVNGNSPLILAITYKRPGIVKILLEKGADPNLIVRDLPPLNFAVWMNEKESVKRLLRAGADINTRDETELNATPLEMAEKQGYTSIASILKSWEILHES